MSGYLDRLTNDALVQFVAMSRQTGVDVSTEMKAEEALIRLAHRLYAIPVVERGDVIARHFGLEDGLQAIEVIDAINRDADAIGKLLGVRR